MKSNSHHSLNTSLKPAQQAGFSLIEVLVVVLIISVMVSLAALSFTPGDSQTKTEGKRIISVLESVRQQSVLFNKDIGILISTKHYEVLEWKALRWEPMEGGQFKRHDIPPHLRFSLWREDGADSALEDPAFADEDEDENPKPHLLFFATGEITPFQWRVEKDQFNETDPWEVTGTILGQFELKEVEEF
ncbi:MAG: prepilin-type N-terminal cleavage/methylation domain-containing protein [Cellvibrionaceae bacterium]